MKSAKKFWYTGSIVVAILIAGGLGFVFLTSPKNTSVDIQPFITYTNSSIDLIEVTSPLPGASVEKEFIVSGKARGTWFFEASFPIKLLDNNGAVLAIFGSHS